MRKRSGTISGDVCLNGWPQDAISFRRCSGYVEQFDVQSPELTVRETIFFSAKLRLDPDALSGDEELNEFVDQVMVSLRFVVGSMIAPWQTFDTLYFLQENVELTSLRDAVVGTEEAGLSFEQKKRLSIAVELAASPSIVFLDEVGSVSETGPSMCLPLLTAFASVL